jgi:hypothetical protein
MGKERVDTPITSERQGCHGSDLQLRQLELRMTRKGVTESHVPTPQ